MKIEERLQELGIELPEPTKPLAAYVPGVLAGHLLFISGQVPMKDGVPMFKGYLGEDVTVEEGYQGARQAAIQGIAIMKSMVGDLDKIAQIVKVNGFVRSSLGFKEQPQVINGASELFLEVFGEKGKHARSAIGCNELPLGTAVEVEMIVQILSP